MNYLLEKMRSQAQAWSPPLTPAQSRELHSTLTLSNLRQMRIMAWVVLGLMIIVLAQQWLQWDDMVAAVGSARSITLLALIRFGWVAVAVIMLAATFRLPDDFEMVSRRHQILEVVIPLLGLLLAVTQDAYRGIAPLGLTIYIAGFLGLAAFLRADWYKCLVIYLPAFILFLALLAWQGTPRLLLLGNTINALICVVLALVVSRVSYLSSARTFLDKQLLERQKEELMALGQMKSQLLSSVSHELRTPLTSIVGFTRLIDRDFAKTFHPLARGDAKAERQAQRIAKNLDVIATEGARLTRLINDVLDLTKIESGRTEWRDQTCAVGELVEQAVQAVSGEFAQRPEVKLSMEVQEQLPPVLVDRDRLVQVLINLLNNASKFTAQGRVAIQALATPEVWVRVEVSDTGPGIPRENLDQIFDQFYQVIRGDTLSDKPKGTGLGLSICKQIVEHYGGRIWAESQLGEGSTFVLELPPAPAG